MLLNFNEIQMNTIKILHNDGEEQKLFSLGAIKLNRIHCIIVEIWNLDKMLLK